MMLQRLLLAWTLLLLGGSLSAQSLLPKIRNVGILPVQWDGNESALSPIQRQKALIESSFDGFVRASGRFQIMNSSLIQKNWKSPAGRRDLVEEFELDAYLALQVIEEDDLLVISARLLSPTLDNYLVESDRVLKTWLVRSSDEDISLRVKKLTFALLNRYPIDVYVTSLQGPYVTLSGGNNQNVFEGDELDFFEIRIKQVHPVNGSWLNYEFLPLGRAKIVESKQYSAIAKLISLQFTGAVNLGSAAKVQGIKSRQLFENISARTVARQDRLSQAQERQFAVEPNTIASGGHKDVVTPPPITPLVGNRPRPAGKDLVQIDRRRRDTQVIQEPAEDQPTLEAEEGDSEPAGTPAPQPPQEGLEDEYFFDGFAALIANSFDEVSVNLGYDSWSSSGSAPFESQSAPWLINRFGAKAVSLFEGGQKLDFSLHFRAGRSREGEYFGFSFDPAFLLNILDTRAELPFLDGLNLGVFNSLQTLQVTGENFGGLDEIILGPMMQLKGRHHMIDAVKSIAFEADVKVGLLASGLAGLNGLSQRISGVFSLNLELSAVIKGAPGQVEWGGMVNYDTRTYKVNQTQLATSNFYLGANARLRF